MKKGDPAQTGINQEYFYTAHGVKVLLIDPGLCGTTFGGRPSDLEMESAVTFVIIGADSTNLIQNHALCSYKIDRLTQNHFRQAQTPTGPSGKDFSTQRKDVTPARRENTSSDSYTVLGAQ